MKTKQCYERHTTCNGNSCKFERCLLCGKMRNPKFHKMSCLGAFESDGYHKISAQEVKL